MRIERSLMDGSERIILSEGESSYLPNQMALGIVNG